MKDRVSSNFVSYFSHSSYLECLQCSPFKLIFSFLVCLSTPVHFFLFGKLKQCLLGNVSFQLLLPIRNYLAMPGIKRGKQSLYMNITLNPACITLMWLWEMTWTGKKPSSHGFLTTYSCARDVCPSDLSFY